eukprot:jgi/Chrpa1/13053/Chrysochromulina_OHIO_Genome00021428-RA
MLDRHQNRMMRTTKTPVPELELSHGLAGSRACLWDTGSRLLAFPGATDDCWAVGGVKTLSRSRSSSSMLASPLAPVRPRTSYDQFRTTSMEIGSHYESALLPPQMGSGASSLVATPLGYRANVLLPSPADAKYQVCVVQFKVPNAKNGGSDKGPDGNRVDSIPIANSVIKAGGACDLILFDSE